MLTTKICTACNIAKEDSEFYVSGRKKYTYCKDCFNKKCYERQKLFKKKCVEYKGGKCELCGYSKCIDAFDFHHKDPSQKEFGLGKVRGRNFEGVKGELDKCVLLCANCHREVHSTS